MSDEQTTDEFVVDQYIKAMNSIENDMISTKNLSPSYKTIAKVDKDELW